MVNTVKKTTNKFIQGLVMDFSPENTNNEILTHALNATLLTFNGNELSLQNDMGNARVETAYLPEGYIPVGTCEYGGIIYIVSYNPLEDKSLIGCFPSPERNISSNELGLSQTLDNDDFHDHKDGTIKNTSKYVLLKNDKLNPGDKFLIYANESIYDEKLVGLEKNSKQITDPILALNIVCIEDSGKITYLNSDVVKYTVGDNKYHILGQATTGNNELNPPDIDEYRNVLSSGYSVFKLKTSGKLAILAELIMIDSYSVTHALEPVVLKNGSILPDQYNLVLYPEVSSTETLEKYGITPKLSYYYLKDSLGKLVIANTKGLHILGDTEENGIWYRPLFRKQLIMDSDEVIWLENDLFNSTTLAEIFGTKNLTSDLLKITLELISAFNFNTPETYREITETITKDSDYEPIVLGNIKLPNKSANNAEIELPFTYNYTIVPCMNYGKLDHLSVSNTVNFNNLYNFDDSTFNVWRYRVDGPTVHLLFGTEINDLYLAYKVKALVLEFYDLWGFAGSLIIDNKKPGAYSGVFNKILTLNTLLMLSRKKVPKTDNDSVIGTYSETYARNINITEDTTGETSKYTLYGTTVERDQESGWYTRNGDKTEPVENDCGILYPNIMYGVKAYFVQDTPNTKSNGELLFTLKEQFFMFTSSIFNNYYYSKRNYNNITNPKLDFVIAYKLLDKSDKTPYTNDKVDIKDGYKTDGKLYPYSQGLSTADTYLEEPIYYKYKGATRLSMEIGLKKEYENINLSYLRDVNNYFGCRLRLVNNDETGTVSINSDGVTLNNTTVLKYPDKLSNPNTLYFTGNLEYLEINQGGFSKYGFLDGVEDEYIDINYEFIVGYNVIISDIKKTNVPVTTVCALCHKKDDGTYNYEDFGIYERDGQYLSDTMFYNSGTGDRVEFGLCHQTQTTGNIINQCNISYSSDYDAVNIRNIRKLNIGDPLKKIIENVGKLSFCSPYVAGLSEENGVNICKTDNGDMYITPDLDGLELNHNKTYGMAPARALYNNPLYTMCVHTKDMINYNSEFAVNMKYTIENISRSTFIIGRDKDDPYNDDEAYKIDSDDTIPAAKYVGLNGTQLAEFNKKLLNTMKSVYAYNPDYNYLSIYAGLISITDNKIQFVSNLLCDLATWDTKQSLNDYVSFGSYKFSNYFKNLTSNSDNIIKTKEDDVTWIPLLNFEPNLYYCGESNPVLISSLTYNTPVTSDMYESLQFNSTDCVVVRHEDGLITKLYGDLNKKALYGFKDGKLISLDIFNYVINDNGELFFKSNPKRDLNQTYILNLLFSEDPIYNYSIWTDIQYTVFNNKIYLLLDSSNINANDKSTYPRMLFWEYDEDSRHTLAQNVMMTVRFTRVPKTFTLNQLSISDINTLMNSLQDLPTVVFETTTDDCNSYYGSPYYQYDSSGNIYIYASEYDEGGWLGFVSDSFVLIELSSLYFNHDKYLEDPILKSLNSIINVTKTTQRYYDNSVGDDKGYTVIDTYKNSVIRGTSITLNDLVYEPNQLGHRLYLRPGCFRFEGVYPAKKLFYRTLTPTDGDTDPTWHGKYYHKNGIFINAGPCFEPDKL